MAGYIIRIAWRCSDLSTLTLIRVQSRHMGELVTTRISVGACDRALAPLIARSNKHCKASLVRGRDLVLGSFTHLALVRFARACEIGARNTESRCLTRRLSRGGTHHV